MIQNRCNHLEQNLSDLEKQLKDAELEIKEKEKEINRKDQEIEENDKEREKALEAQKETHAQVKSKTINFKLRVGDIDTEEDKIRASIREIGQRWH